MGSSKTLLSGSIAGGLSTLFVGFMAALCRWFDVTPDGLKKPGTHGKSPISSAGSTTRR